MMGVMISPSRVKKIPYLSLGFLLVFIGMLNEFLLGTILPSELMYWLYHNGILLCLLIFFFGFGMYLIRYGVFGRWRSKSDTIVLFIGVLLCSMATTQTVLNLQAGHPFTFLQETNPLLMILLWAFILPPINPVTTALLATALAIIAILNFVKPVPINLVLDETILKETQRTTSRRQVVILLVRINVWIGSIFLFIIMFILLGGPPLSPPPNLPLYNSVTWLRVLIALLSASFLNSFIFVQNQLGDLDTDRLHDDKSQLPLASRYLSRRMGIILAVCFLFLAVALAVLVSLGFLITLLVIVFLGFLYSLPPFRLKSKPVLDLVMIGLAFGTMAVLAAWTVHNSLPTLPILLLIGPGIFYAGTHSIHVATDYKADLQAGVKTTAVQLGPNRSIILGIVLVALGLVFIYAAVGYYIHLFWYGLLKFKSIFLLTFCGLPFFTILEATHLYLRSKEDIVVNVNRLEKEGRLATYLLFIILLIYCLLYVFVFYPVYYPSYLFPWS